jgi:hypothetical protein
LSVSHDKKRRNLKLSKQIKTNIAGVTYKNQDGTDRQTLLKKIKKGDLLFLERESDNKYDVNAIKVLNKKGQQLGYIKSELAEDLSAYLDNGESFKVIVLDKHGGNANKPTIGCNIQLILNRKEEYVPKSNNVKRPANRMPWYRTKWAAWISTFFFPPFGIFLMWRYSHHSSRLRIIVTVIGTIIFLLGMLPE